MSQYALSLTQRADFSHTFLVLDGLGQPIDLSAFTITADLKKSATDTTTLAQFDCVGSSDGRLTLSMSKDVTAALTHVACVYDVKLSLNNDVTHLFRNSKAILTTTVTRDVVAPRYGYTPRLYTPSPYSPRPYVG